MNSCAAAARGGGLDLGVAGLRAAEADVLARRVGEDHRLLRHQRELAAQVGAGHVAQVDAVERRPGPASGSKKRMRSWKIVVLPAPEGPTSATVSPGRTCRSTPWSAGVVRARGVAEGDGLEGDLALEPGGQRRAGSAGSRDRVGGVRGARPCARWRRRRAAARPRSSESAATGAGDHHRVDDELDELARGHRAGADVAGADPEHGDDRGEDQEDDDRGHHRAGRGSAAARRRRRPR